MKKILSILAVVMLIVSCFTLSAFAETSSVSNTDYAEIDYPIWQKFEKARDSVPTSFVDGETTYNINSHFLAYAPYDTYVLGEFKGKAKLYCYGFDSDFVSDFSYSTVQNWIVWNAKDISQGRLYYWSYDFVNDKWVYEGYDRDLFSSGDAFISLHRNEAVLTSDFYVQDSGSQYTFLNPGDVINISAPSWQSLTWDVLSSVPSSMMNEVIGILPFIVSILLTFLSIRKGISFMLNTVRKV